MAFIPVNEPLLDGNEKKYLCECIDTGWISSEGPFVERLEKNMAEYVGRKYGVAVCNGSVALDLAVEILGLKQGDEVIIPTFTIISCASALVHRGIKPVLVDADVHTWNMDVTKIEEKITAKTKAIMVVHLYGLPVDMDIVNEIATRHSLYIIEDAAEAHGLRYRGKHCGSFGDISTFSFYPNKHITTGEGGMVLMDDLKWSQRCSSYRNLCHSPQRRFLHEDLGYNFRITNIQAAVGVAQLEKIDHHLQLKRALGTHYQALLSGIDGLTLPLDQTDYAENIYWVFGLLIDRSVEITAIDAMKQLAEKGIGCRPFFYPMHRQPVFRKMGLFEGEHYPIADHLGEKGFYLPSGLTVTAEQRVYITQQVSELFSR
ncbi:MAG: DegT/DnrJ/EryC1/StrS family aminotransferase [Lachnospiraceae bacterium]|jgi:perosamine synthetase|nr:DegT/DnrJ/EryC1/StrS family aminotransferase [Lachnospiraceae bacterium]